MRSRLLPLCMAALLAGAGGGSVADDGAITNKSMSKTIQVPVFNQEVVNTHIPEAEHAFTDMMEFYVPSQAASGLVGPIAYCDIDNQPESGEDCTNAVETLEVAKPLVNTFIYGPAIEVEGTAFAHRWFDTYAAVSLDDGETWKQTNLSESADQSSFNLDTDHDPGTGDKLPNDHTIFLGDDDEDEDEGAYHAPGYETPYASHCSECHGVALQGTTQAPSCYSCHDNVWSEDIPIELGPIVFEAEMDGDTLKIEGENAASKVYVTIINAITGVAVGTDQANRIGEFELEQEFQGELPPCVVAAEYTDTNGTLLVGPAVSVLDEETGERIESCEGSPVDLTDYPGGTFNVFQATAGNKTLVAWPSRFCSQGQPGYAMTTENADPERLEAVVSFLQNGDADLGVPALPDFSMDNDLYLVDAFGVAGSQGSIDFADEGYPQAGVVPFGCVWTARGVMLPGDDPRTDETESSHMVWTKAERLTSGRRDPNRIEVQAVQGAGFVITWQEDPDGLRPGQGEGPGEGWSGAVAHPQTDAWYSFINWEYFDIVETVDNTTVPINILDHDLLESGRPQVFVPMAVPMRLTNNAKCNPPDTVTSGGGTPPLYCTKAALDYGLKDQCVTTVTIQTGNENNPSETEICVADSNGDGVADLPNRANTAATRPRTSLQGYDASDTDKSAWVVVALEESKGLGKFFFEPDGINNTLDGFAEPCEEGSTDTCAEEIGKNQWYFSFDMGTPDTSAGILEPNSLVNNLVYQGDLLNQPEVYWQTGEFYGLMDTSIMGDGGTSLYGDYDYQIVGTEIARRASLLVQGIGKAMASEYGLMATPSWKQGPMRQGGPADTMLRRVVMPEGYGGGIEPPQECPLDEKVDAPVPVVDFARYFVLPNGSGRIELQVDGLDGIIATPVRVNNAVTDARVIQRRYDEDDAWTETAEDFYFRFAVGPGSTRPVPCSIQLADVDGSLELGPWIAVENAPVDCEGPIPEECLVESCPINDNVDAEQPVVESAALRVISTGGWRLQVTVSGYDGIPWDRTTRTGTRLQLRNAENRDLYGYPRSVDETGASVTYDINADTWNEIPCAIQVADWDVATPAFGPWKAVDTSAVPGLQCTGEIPPACTTDGMAPMAVLAAAATEGIEVNPYAFENIACENWLFNVEKGGVFNPYYPKGVCLDPATNLSGVVPDVCIDDGAEGALVDCPTVEFGTSSFGIGDTDPILQGSVQGEGNTMRVLQWHQCPSDGAAIAENADFTPVTCADDNRDDEFVNLKDQSWYNPLDVSKGHRGFLDGDFVQFLYGWSPNWRLNAKGNDRYELYIRRSFDGGNTWTTTPTSFTASDGNSYPGNGTVTCETYRSDVTGTGDTVPPKVCYQYPAGGNEQARNVTQLKSNRLTTLDPRYSPTGGPRGVSIKEGCTDGLFLNSTVIDGIFTCDDESEFQDTDLRNPSRFFVIYEVGDNTTSAVGEAEPLDLYYSRAEGFGDDYVVWTETDTDSANPEECFPTVDYGVLDLGAVVGSGFCNEFDNMNTGGDTHASEGDLVANPDGSKLYTVWAQWVFADDDDYESEIIESDAMARRVWWIDNWVSTEGNAYTLPGTQQTTE